MMFHDFRVNGINYRMVAGSFAPDTASAPTDLLGGGFTAAYTTTGVFTVTFDQQFKNMISCISGLQLSTATGLKVDAGDYVAASKTLVFNVWDIAGAAAANIAADANNRISFICVFEL